MQSKNRNAETSNGGNLVGSIDYKNTLLQYLSITKRQKIGENSLKLQKIELNWRLII